MTEFKLLKLKLLLLLMSFVAATGCVKASKHNPLGKPGGNEQMQFRMRGNELVDISGYSEILQSADIEVDRVSDVKTTEYGHFSNVRNYVLKLCGIQDKYNNGSLIGQELEIFSELPIQGNKVQQITGSDNCVKWNVALPYNYFGDSVFLGVNFIFKTPKAKAYIHRTVFFNPWDNKRGSNPEFGDYTRSGLTNEIRDLDWAYGTEKIEAALKGEYIKTRKVLEVGSVNIVPVSREKYSSNTIGAGINEGFDERKNREFRAALSGNQTPTEALDLHLNIYLNALKVRLYDSSKNFHDEDLKTGRYKVEATLVATGQNNKGHYIISDKVPLANTPNWQASTMGILAVLPMSVALRPQWGNINLVLKVTPLDLAGIEEFQAIYHLGTYDSISGGKSLMPKVSDYTEVPEDARRDTDPSMTFDYMKYLGAALNHDDWVKGHAANGVTGVSTFEAQRTFMFTPLTVLFGRIMAGDTATDRTIQYTVNTCVIYNFTGRKPGSGLMFDITTDDRGVKTTVRYATDNNGCLNWVGMISHKFYQRESLIPKVSSLVFLGDASDIDDTQVKQEVGKEYKLEYYINPWDEKFTFGRDKRALPMGYIDDIKRDQDTAPPTRILMTDFRYDATGFRYVIDKYMNMTVKKTVLMTIHPKILKYNSILWGRGGFSELRDGIYLMKIAMQKDYLDPTARGRKINCKPIDCAEWTQDENGQKMCKTVGPAGLSAQDCSETVYDNNGKKIDSEILGHKQFLTVKEMLVRVLGGLIITPIEFDVDDLRTLRIRSQMLIQIETIDETLLRAMMAIDTNLEKMKQLSAQTTVQLSDMAATEDLINQKLAEAKQVADAKDMMEAIQKLESEGAAVRERMQALVGSLDRDALEKIIADLKRIRRAGEVNTSVDANMVYQTMNNALSNMQFKMYRHLGDEQPYGRLGERSKKTIQESYVESQSLMCQEKSKMYDLAGRKEDAVLWWDKAENAPGRLCQTKIPDQELFYHIASYSEAGSDEWLKSIFTENEYELYRTGRLPDDFTRANKPTYSFDLLSNQGDERLVSPNASGLPRRTFIGPVTFVLNGNGSALRPTDVLDEYSCQGTCAQPSDAQPRFADDATGQFSRLENETANNELGVKDSIPEVIVKSFGLSVNAQYEDSPYYGSVSHFYMKQVNDLIPVANAIDAEYQEEMRAFSRVGNMLELMNYNYVSFAPRQTQVKTLDYNCFARWKAENDAMYAKWRGQFGDINNKPIEPYYIKHLGQECFVPSKHAVHKNAFMKNINVSGNAADNMYANANVLKHYNLRPVGEQQLKEFSKNGLMSNKLDFETKVNILHRSCYILRKGLVPSSETEMSKRIENRYKANQNVLKTLFTSIGNTRASVAAALEDYEKSCHELVDVFAKDVTEVAKGQPMSVWLAVIAAKSRQLPIVVERKVRVVDTSKRYIYRDGKTINYNVGTSFSMSNSFGLNRGYKVDPVEFLEKGVGLFGAIGDKISSFIGVGGAVANFAWASNESESQSNGTSVSSNTTIAGQISTLDIELSQWEKCVIVQHNPKFASEKLAQINGNMAFGSGGAYNASEDIQSLGTMMCSGDVDTKDDQLARPHNGSEMNVEPLRVRERYYYFTQIFNEGDMQDPGALANHPWMLQMRGSSDFAKFHKALVVAPDELNWGSIWGIVKNDLLSFLQAFKDKRFDEQSIMQVVDPNDTNKALNMMAESYSSVMPTFPGMYTYSDSQDDLVTNWPESQKP